MIFDKQIEIANGLHTLLKETQGYTESLPQKLCAMEKMYFQSNSEVYDDTDKQNLQYFREAFCYKFYLATMHLEQLWTLNYSRQSDFLLGQVLSNIFDNHKTNNEELLLYSFALEEFILQGNTFLGFYMLYLCYIFQIQGINYLSGKKFLGALKQVQSAPLAANALSVKQYFEKKCLAIAQRLFFRPIAGVNFSGT